MRRGVHRNTRSARRDRTCTHSVHRPLDRRWHRDSAGGSDRCARDDCNFARAAHTAARAVGARHSVPLAAAVAAQPAGVHRAIRSVSDPQLGQGVARASRQKSRLRRRIPRRRGAAPHRRPTGQPHQRADRPAGRARGDPVDSARVRLARRTMGTARADGTYRCAAGTRLPLPCFRQPHGAAVSRPAIRCAGGRAARDH